MMILFHVPLDYLSYLFCGDFVSPGLSYQLYWWCWNRWLIWSFILLIYCWFIGIWWYIVITKKFLAHEVVWWTLLVDILSPTRASSKSVSSYCTVLNLMEIFHFDYVFLFILLQFSSWLTRRSFLRRAFCFSFYPSFLLINILTMRHYWVWIFLSWSISTNKMQ